MRRLWRLTSRTLAQVAVENGSANLQHAMHAFERPLHLLLFDHPPGNKGIDSGLSERATRSNRLCMSGVPFEAPALFITATAAPNIRASSSSS